MERARLSNLQEVFVSFETEKLVGCSVVYLNESLANGKTSVDILNDYSYAVRPELASSEGKVSVKIFMAERYGGDGILSNGGGGRCGFDGIWQLKGLGPNQLVGNNVDPGHSDGNLCLSTAIYESIWSEIINVALPLGAIRTIAILDTGCLYDARGTAAPRGLLVRQPVVRPAHFIRATYFEEKQMNRLSEDAQRVKNAIVKLVDFLPSASAISTVSGMRERLHTGFLVLVTRFAEQFAAAKAKHIIHYNVSASNLSLDGAWLDLSGACLFTHLINGDRLDVDRFNNEYLPALESIHSMCYYLSKYSVITAEESAHLLDETITHFWQIYERQLSAYQVAQAGFPLWILRVLVDSTELASFANSLRKLYMINNFTVNAITLEGGWSGYERWTARLFNELLSSKINTSDIDLSWLEMDFMAISQLISSYNKLFDLAYKVADEQHITQHNFYRCMLINATRLNRSHILLHDLKERIEFIELCAKVDRKAAYRTLSDEAMLAARLNLENENGTCVPFWLNNVLSISFDSVSGMFTLQAADSYSLQIDDPFEIVEHKNDISTALGFYRSAWSILGEKS